MNFRTTLILAILVAGMAVAVFVLQQQGPPEDPDGPKAELQKVFQGASSGAITRIEFSRRSDGKTIVLQRDGSQWRLTAPVKGRADRLQVSHLMTLLGNVEYMTRKPLNAKSKASYGLEPAVATLKFTSGEKTFECAVGLELSVTEGGAKTTYVRPAGADHALLAKGALASLLDADLHEWRDKKLLDWREDDVHGVTIAAGEQTLEARREGVDWMITKPIRARADRDAVGELVRAATGLNVDSFEADDPKDLAEFGLDKPRLVITLEKPPAVAAPPEPDARAGGATPELKPPETVAIAFGAFSDTSKKALYAQVSGTQTVVVVDAASLEGLEKDMAALRDRRAFAINRVAEVTFLSVEMAGDAVAVERVTPVKWQITAPQQAPADTRDVENLIKRLRGVTVEEFDDTAQPTDTRFGFNSPYGTVTFRRGGDTRDTTVLIGRQESTGDLWAMETGTGAAGRLKDDVAGKLRITWLDLHSRSLWKAVPGQTVGSVSWTRGDETVTITRQADGAYKMTAPVEEELDKEKVAEAVMALGRVDAVKCLAPVSKAADYGLDQVGTTLRVTFTGGGEPVTHMLRLAEHEGDSVAVLVGGTMIVALDKSVTEVFDKPMSKNVWGHFERADVYRLEVNGPGTDVAFDRDKGTAPADVGKWVAAGKAVKATRSSSVRMYLMDLAGASAERIAAYAATDLSRFGLDKPEWRIRAKGLSVDRVYLISAHGPDGGRFATVEGSNRVVVLSGEHVSRLMKDKSYFEEKKPN